MRIVVVDDQASQRDGRVTWLAQLPDTHVEGKTFEEALAFGPQWRDVDTVVLDNHDRRSAQRRADAARAAQVEPIPPYEKFAGVRVAQAIREHSPSERTTIIMISAYARDNSLLARRVAQAGVDYLFEHYEVDDSPATFVRAILSPASFSLPVAQQTIDWSVHGYTKEPDVSSAVAAVEASPAGQMLLADDVHKRNKPLEWAVRKLRKDLERWLPRRGDNGSGPRRTEGPSKRWFADQFRRIFGQDLPVDPK
jgi:CheY-like chemotaxis protein